MSGTVLVIEDEVDLATTLEYNLRSNGLTARLAHTAKAGLEAAASDPLPDVIVLDLMLPDLSGTEVCRRLRDNPHTRAIPIIMCTAKGDEIDRVVGFEVGADDYVVKPYSVRELLLRIRAMLRRTQRRRVRGGTGEQAGDRRQRHAEQPAPAQCHQRPAGHQGEGVAVQHATLPP